MRRAALFSLSIGIGVLTGCDLPTAAMDLVDGGTPRFESRIVIPTEDTELRVAQLLPNSVTESGANFSMTVAPTAISRTLATACLACIPLNGITAPKPAFSDSVPVVVALPADVTSAVLTSGIVRITLTHNYGWDPLRPTGGPDGSIVVTIRNGTRVLGTATINQAFPSGTTIERDIQLASGTLTGNITASAVMTSPGGGPVLMNTATSFSATATPMNLLISQGTVTLVNRPVQVNQAQVDLSDIDDAISDRVTSGALQLRITNPFAVAGNFTVSIQGGSQPITKQISLTANQTAATVVRVEFSAAELQSILGRDITLSMTGTVSGTGGTVTVQPGQEVSIDTTLEVLLNLGFGGES